MKRSEVPLINHVAKRFALVVLLLCLAGCASMGDPLELTLHPLVGKIWDTSSLRFLSEEEVTQRINESDFVLLGENHDNLAHHRIQVHLLKNWSKKRPGSPVVMEPFDREHQSAIDAATKSNSISADDVMNAGKMSRGWDRDLYRPIIEQIIIGRLPLKAGNLSREQGRPIITRGLEALDSATRDRLALDSAWNSERQQQMKMLIINGHCGRNSPAIEGLARMQRARDAFLADALLEASSAIAIMGRGHARRDLAVPLYLGQRRPQSKILSLALLEVEEDKEDPTHYEDARPTLHDLVWFTPRAERDDPCSAFR